MENNTTPKEDFFDRDKLSSVEREGFETLQKQNFSKSLSFKKLLLIFIVLLVFLIFPILFLLLRDGEESDEVHNEESITGDVSLVEEDGDFTKLVNDVSTWGSYINDEFGFEFKYPSDWAPIKVEKQLTQDLFLFTSENSSIEEIYYNEPLELLALVSFGEEHSYQVGAMEEPAYYNEMVLTYFYQDGQEELIYKTSNFDNCQYPNIKSLNFSPCGRYINFSHICFTNSIPVIFDTEKEEVLLHSNLDEVYWDSSYEDVLWVSDSTKFFVRGRLSLDPLEVERNVIWKGSFSSYDTFIGVESIFSLNQIEDYEEGLEISEITLVDDNVLNFKIQTIYENENYDEIRDSIDFEPVLIKYEYNIQEAKLLKKR